MPIFCPLTGQLLTPIVTNGSDLVFVSTVTKLNYPADPVDTLRFTEDLKKSTTSVSTRQLQNLTDDNVNPRKLGFCPSCKKLAIIMVIQNGEEMETINGCSECKFQFPEV
jgi:DNA-directed RNA polymerase subunit M/transcription elongation factor TFIIS